MGHEMILLSADLRTVYARLAARRKKEIEEGRISSGDRASASYPEDSGLSPLSGSNLAPETQESAS